MADLLSPTDTPVGTLPPFEVAKAFAFHVVLAQMEKHSGKTCRQLLGEDKRTFVGRQLVLKGGGRPGHTAVTTAVRKCKEPGWFPGKVLGKRTGRPPAFSERQKKAMARVAMETKRQLVKPTPARVRAKLPRLSLNPETAAPVSNWTLYKVMHTMCSDDTEDDPWVFLYSPCKDYLCDEMKERRVVFAEHLLEHVPARAWWSHVAIDPCITILARTDAQSEDQRIAAMGAKKMMSPKSRFVGANLRAPATAKTQGREDDKVHWTPVFARGKVHIYVCDVDAARCDPRLPARLNNGSDVGKFTSNVLPDILEKMKQEYGWARVPRTVVHDKASYFVAPRLRDKPRTVAGVAGSGGGCRGVGSCPIPACDLARWGLGPLDLGTPAAVVGSSLEGVSASPHRLKKHYAALASLAGWATETQTADGLQDAWAMCTCTRRLLGTSAMVSTTASPAAPLGRRATSSRAAWPR